MPFLQIQTSLSIAGLQPGCARKIKKLGVGRNKFINLVKKIVI